MNARTLVAGACVGAGVIALVAWTSWQDATAPAVLDSPPPRRADVFVEHAAEAGIDFTMQFLPAEQGENFKINLYDHGCGVAVADCDEDGDDDVLFLNQLGPNALYRNTGDGRFTKDLAADAVLGLADRVCVGAVFGDYDNDGDQDLYITGTRGGNVMLRNEGKGRFVDVTEALGLTLVRHSQTPTFFDFDNDGDLDLLVTNSAEWTANQTADGHRYYPGVDGLAALAGSRIEHNNFYRNDGDRFTDVTRQVGLEGPGWGGDTAVFDYDEDGFLDVLVTNMFGASTLYHNEAGARFVDVTMATLGPTSFGAIGTRVFDANGDGRLDLFIADMHSDMWLPGGSAFAVDERQRYTRVSGPLGSAEDEQGLQELFNIDYERVRFGNTLFENQGNGRFRETAVSAGAETFWPWGVAPGDFDCDGDEDVFIPSGMGYPWRYWKNALLRNRGDGTFEEASAAFGIEPPPRGPNLGHSFGGAPAARSSRCAATGDFDGDGRLDLMVNNFNDAPYFFHNRLPKANFIALRLRGVRGTRDAVGAVVRLEVGDKVLVRQVQSAGGYLAQSSKTLHFGLGNLGEVRRAVIHWPGGAVQELSRPAVNRLHEVEEAS